MDVGLLVFALCLIVALAAIGIAIFAYYAWRSMPHRSQPKQVHQSSETEARRPTEIADGDTRGARSRLLNMVAGDQATADRLVAQVRASNPKQSWSWCWEKAVEDLLRDRH